MSRSFIIYHVSVSAIGARSTEDERSQVLLITRLSTAILFAGEGRRISVSDWLYPGHGDERRATSIRLSIEYFSK